MFTFFFLFFHLSVLLGFWRFNLLSFEESTHHPGIHQEP
jgi:hypothetical protein